MNAPLSVMDGDAMELLWWFHGCGIGKNGRMVFFWVAPSPNFKYIQFLVTTSIN
jgi:hypothetical protein